MTPARQPLPLVAVGHVTLDRVGERKVLGGSAWYAASAWRALGEQVRLITAAGPELPPFAPWRGLNVELRRAQRTTEFSNLHEGGGSRRLILHGQACPLPPLGQGPPCDVLFLAPVLGEVPLEAWRRATDARLIGAGLQGWLKQAGPDGEVVARPDLIDPTSFEGVDVACLSEEDLAGDDGWLARLAEVVPVVALTLAERGCELICRGAPSVRVPTPEARSVDPTGAGDAFAAGLLRAIARGASPLEAASAAVALGAAAVEHVGAPPVGAVRAADCLEHHPGERAHGWQHVDAPVGGDEGGQGAPAVPQPAEEEADHQDGQPGAQHN